MLLQRIKNEPDLAVPEIKVLRRFIPLAQMRIISLLSRGEEGAFFLQKLAEVSALVRAMPVTGDTAKFSDPLAHLHYFGRGGDAWIIERDVGDGTEPRGLGAQHQAFGCVDLGYGPELGYVSLPELFEAGFELDLYWTAIPYSRVRQRASA